jgi:hypothetical protein
MIAFLFLAWRRYRGRKWRKATRIAQQHAATVIQRATRRWLQRQSLVRNEAAKIIQRNWRLQMFMRFCLMKAKYRKPLRDLHRAAKLVQRNYRLFQTHRRQIRRRTAEVTSEELQRSLTLHIDAFVMFI